MHKTVLFLCIALSLMPAVGAEAQKSKPQDTTVIGTVAEFSVSMLEGRPHPRFKLEGHPEQFTMTPDEGKQFGLLSDTSLINPKGWKVEVTYQQAETKDKPRYLIKSFKRIE